MEADDYGATDTAPTKSKLMPVKEAIALTNKTAITLEDVANNIKMSASNVKNNCKFFDILVPFDVMADVLSAGYLISQNKGLGGETITIISW